MVIGKRLRAAVSGVFRLVGFGGDAMRHNRRYAHVNDKFFNVQGGDIIQKELIIITKSSKFGVCAAVIGERCGAERAGNVA